jgi:hypothetical protein
LNPEKISDFSVVLIKQGNHAEIYFIRASKIVSDQHKILVRHFDLSLEQSKFIEAQPSTGLVKRNMVNKKLIDQLINNALVIYNYRYLVYYRKPLNEWVGSL